METRKETDTTFPTARPAGWYDDPNGKHPHQAYWDGYRWTGDTRPNPDGARKSVGTTSEQKLTEAEMWFSYKGRIGVGQYWGRFLTLAVLGLMVLLALAASGASETGVGSVSGLLYLGSIWPSTALATKRLHDQDKSGAMFLLVLIPLVGSILWLVWSLSRGTTGPNRYGPSTGYR